jgi:thioredoxin-related protein
LNGEEVCRFLSVKTRTEWRITMTRFVALVFAAALLSAPRVSAEPVAPEKPTGGEGARWLTDLEKARELAQRDNKPILLLFTGTQWCGVCIQLEKNVLSRPEFAEFAKDRLILVKVEFETAVYKEPKEKRTPEQTAKVDLARRFNMNVGEPSNRGLNGYPSAFLLSPKGETMAQINTNINAAQAGVQPFLKSLSQALARDKTGRP